MRRLLKTCPEHFWERLRYFSRTKNTDGRAGERIYTPNPDGTFEIADVDPGEYILTAQVQDPV